MAANIDEVVSAIEYVAPIELAEEWDNSGLQLRCAEKVNSALIALDVTHAVADEAVESGCDMIISHHPLIFSPIKALSENKPGENVVMRLVKAGISVYSAHTSFDKAAGGINDELAKMLGLNGVKTIDGDGEGLLRVGALPQPMDRDGLSAHIKRVLGIDYLVTTDAECGMIENLGIAGGSGGGFLAAARENGAAALLTGEAKHSHHIEAVQRGMLLVEAGHYATEQCFVSCFFDSLQSRLDAVQLHLGLKTATRESAPSRIG